MNNFLRKKGQKGFTLIELLVVIAVISLLSSIIMGQLNIARSKARDAVRISDLQNIRRALELYKLDNNEYPITTGFFPYAFSSNITTNWDRLKTDLSPYITLTGDPLNNTGIYPLFIGFEGVHNYFYNSNGNKYNLIARFEQANQNDCSTRQYKVNFTLFGFTEGESWCSGTDPYLLYNLYSDH